MYPKHSIKGEVVYRPRRAAWKFTPLSNKTRAQLRALDKVPGLNVTAEKMAVFFQKPGKKSPQPLKQAVNQ